MGSGISRRSFIRLSGVAVGASAVGGLLAACGSSSAAPSTTAAGAGSAQASASVVSSAPASAPPKPSTAPSGGAAASGSPAAGGSAASVRIPKGITLPTYTPVQGPPPDLPGTPAAVPPAYTSYPKNVIQAVQQARGKGDEITTTTYVISGQPP
ncbi:MAG: hypothetical protein JO247_18985, partial [Chloroflexi bacterium]|nr:hypothetical protein [Chloroflexota bacterium]